MSKRNLCRHNGQQEQRHAFLIHQYTWLAVIMLHNLVLPFPTSSAALVVQLWSCGSTQLNPNLHADIPYQNASFSPNAPVLLQLPANTSGKADKNGSSSSGLCHPCRRSGCMQPGACLLSAWSMPGCCIHWSKPGDGRSLFLSLCLSSQPFLASRPMSLSYQLPGVKTSLGEFPCTNTASVCFASQAHVDKPLQMCDFAHLHVNTLACTRFNFNFYSMK